MTYIITKRTNNSILMASDSRLEYFKDITIEGKKCKKIIAIADCIQKTFFIESANIGIQFEGIGFFPDNDDEYPLSHFINKIGKLNFKKDFRKDSTKIFEFFKDLSIEKDTGQYVKGMMAGFYNNTAYISTFNTYNSYHNIQQRCVGNFVDSEGNKNSIPDIESEAILEIKRRIQEKENEKWWTIGGPIDLLKIKKDSFSFIEKNNNVFEGCQSQLIENFNNNIDKINGKLLREPKIVPYNSK